MHERVIEIPAADGRMETFITILKRVAVRACARARLLAILGLGRGWRRDNGECARAALTVR
jgi:hypothetical protein